MSDPNDPGSMGNWIASSAHRRMRHPALRFFAAALALAFLAASCSAGTASRKPRTKRRGTAADLKCERNPQCVRYLENIKRSVDRVWKPGPRVSSGSVVLRMKLDGTGTPTRLDTIRADSQELSTSCRTAIRYAEPFGPLPVSLAFLKDQEITVEFEYARASEAP